MAGRGGLRRIGAWLALLPLASAFMAPALPALPSCASPRAREPAFARLHNRIQHQPRMGLLEDMRAANAERMAINEGKNLVGSKYGVKTLQAFPCRVLKEDWKADKLSGMLQVRPRQPVVPTFSLRIVFPHMRRLGNSAQNCHARRPAASAGLCPLTHSSFRF